MTQHKQASSQAYNAFYQICAEAGSDVVAEENAALSIGREFLPEFALKALDKVELTPREEREYYEWLTDGVQTAMTEHAATLNAGHEWHAAPAATETVHPLRAAVNKAAAAAEEAQAAYDDCETPNAIVPGTTNGLLIDFLGQASTDADEALEAAKAALVDSDCPRLWSLREEGTVYETDVVATSVEEALEIARGNVDRDNYNESEGTLYIDVRVYCPETEEQGSDTVTCEAEFPVGTKVRLTGKFLRYTGQQLGSAGQSLWVVRECACTMCRDGKWLCTNERASNVEALYTAQECLDNPSVYWRHIAVANLESVR